MPLKDFQILSRLGQGAYSSVYIAKRISDSQQYALKQVKLLNLTDVEKNNSLTEVRILASMKNDNIVAYKEAFIENNCLYIVMEFMNSGDLFQKIQEHQKAGTYFKEHTIWIYLAQILKGLKALHKANILHRDLKSANVFLSKNNVAKLGDLNVSKISQEGMCVTQTGTPYYASPEVWDDQPYNNKSDIWSLGCIAYEMAMLKPPFRAQDMEGLYKKVQKGVYPKLSKRYSDELALLIKQMLEVNPKIRPSCGRCSNNTEQLLEVKQMKQYYNQSNTIQLQSNILKTIYLPKNLSSVNNQSIFPLPSYRSFQSPHIVLPQLDITNSPAKSSKLPPQKLKYRMNHQTPQKIKHKSPEKEKSLSMVKENRINYSMILEKSQVRDNSKERLPEIKVYERKKKAELLKKIYIN